MVMGRDIQGYSTTFVYNVPKEREILKRRINQGACLYLHHRILFVGSGRAGHFT